MRKFSRTFWIGGGCILEMLLCCGLFLLFFDGYLLPYKPCRPLEFPSLEKRTWPKPGEIYKYETIQSIDEVVVLFDQKLNPIVLSEEEPFIVAGPNWIKKRMDDGTHVYQCISGDINDITVEQGCMYIKEIPEGTLIQTGLWVFETSNPLCDSTSIMP